MSAGIGDHLTSRKVKGSTYQVVGKDRKYLRVRCLQTGTPALIRRNQLDRWQVVFTPKAEPGLQGLEKKGRFLVRTDAPERPRSRA